MLEYTTNESETCIMCAFALNFQSFRENITKSAENIDKFSYILRAFLFSKISELEYQNISLKSGWKYSTFLPVCFVRWWIPLFIAISYFCHESACPILLSKSCSFGIKTFAFWATDFFLDLFVQPLLSMLILPEQQIFQKLLHYLTHKFYGGP